jgi:hypothetical protein
LSFKILHWWPIIPALLILFLGGKRFIHNYPRDLHTFQDSHSDIPASDSLLVFIRAEMKKDSSATASPPIALDSITANKNPFRSPHSSAMAGKRLASGPKAIPPGRKYILKGTVGDQVATIEDPSGQKHIVKVGDRVDSAIVYSIESNKVVLKDRAGKFDLIHEP